MAKQLKYAAEAREKLKKGVDAVAQAVGTTLGPKGRNIALDKKWGAPSVVHDGVSVAKEIDLEDPFENMGAQLVKEAAEKTNDVAGDGTTTATIIAQAIMDEGLKALTSGINPMDLKREIDEAVSIIARTIKKQAIEISKKEDIQRVGTVAAQDEKIGSLIAEAMEKVGKDGFITVEEGKGIEVEIEYKEGMKFDKGYTSPYFVTDPDSMEATIENPYILLTDKKISSLQELLPFLENLVKTSKNLVIIADEVEGEALATLVVNKLRGTFNVLAVEAPGFGDRRKEMLEDIAVLTGGTVISEDVGRKLEEVAVEDLGRTDRVTADKDNTVIVGGKGSKRKIEGRIKQIRTELNRTTSEFDKEKLEERLAKLTGGVAQVNVGAATEIEMGEKKERVKDAVGATKAAVEEGIIAGGGAFLYEAREKLATAGAIRDGILRERKFPNPGFQVVYNALGLPLVRILENAYGPVDKAANTRLIVGRIDRAIDENIIKQRDKKTGRVNFEKYKFANYGHDVVIVKDGNMLEELGIIDPAKVVKSALQNAASVATMILTTEGLVTDIPEEKKETPGMPPSGGGMGM